MKKNCPICKREMAPGWDRWAPMWLCNCGYDETRHEVKVKHAALVCKNGHDMIVGKDGTKLAWNCKADCTRSHFEWWRPEAFDEITLLLMDNAPVNPANFGWSPISELYAQFPTGDLPEDWGVNVVELDE